jgi:SSS family solute:Na+ symporter
VLFVAMVLSSLVYITFSLFEGKIFNLDQMLHRGKYAINKDDVVLEQGTGKPKKEYNVILQRLGLSHEFSFTDKLIFWATVSWSTSWFIVFIIGSIYNLLVNVSDHTWFEYWKIYSWISFFIAIVTTVWFVIGWLMNVKQMFRDLAVAKSDSKDDGMVIDHHNSNEKNLEKV